MLPAGDDGEGARDGRAGILQDASAVAGRRKGDSDDLGADIRDAEGPHEHAMIALGPEFGKPVCLERGEGGEGPGDPLENRGGADRTPGGIGGAVQLEFEKNAHPRSLYPRTVSDPRSQQRFQVRFGWGADSPVSEGAHVLVWCDALPTGHGIPDFDGAVLAGSTGSAAAVAQWILALQEQRGDRAIVAVIAAGTDAGGFAVEDFLAAGAVIDALATVGLDFNSPEAASACAAYEGLRNATLHLTSASETGQVVGSEALAAAKAVNADPAVRVLR